MTILWMLYNRQNLFINFVDFLYSVVIALTNLCTVRHMREGPILIDPIFFKRMICLMLNIFKGIQQI